MAALRLARLQKRIRRWFAAAASRTNGVILSSPEEWVQALDAEKGKVSRSLQTLAARGGASSGARLVAMHTT
jgi:hypothetical protein